MVNGSQNNLIPVLEFNFDWKSLIVGYDIEMIIFHSWFTVMPFFTKMAMPPLVPTSLSFLYMS